MKWIKEIPDYRKFLNDDFNKIIDIVGVDKFIELYEFFQKTPLYFSSEPIKLLRKKYIELNHRKEDSKEIARKIGVSNAYVYKQRSSLPNDPDTIDMFE